MVFQKNDNNQIYLINKYGNFNDETKILLTLCYISNRNHFNVIYEKQIENTSIYYNNVLDIKNYSKKKFKYCRKCHKFCIRKRHR